MKCLAKKGGKKSRTFVKSDVSDNGDYATPYSLVQGGQIFGVNCCKIVSVINHACTQIICEDWLYGFKHFKHRHYTMISGQLHAPSTLPPGKESPVSVG
jgi:hypothetical protein